MSSSHGQTHTVHSVSLLVNYKQLHSFILERLKRCPQCACCTLFLDLCSWLIISRLSQQQREAGEEENEKEGAESRGNWNQGYDWTTKLEMLQTPSRVGSSADTRIKRGCSWSWVQQCLVESSWGVGSQPLKVKGTDLGTKTHHTYTV